MPHLPDYELTEEWVDITTLPQYADLPGKDATVQGKYVREAYIWIGPSEPDNPDDGSLLLTAMAFRQVADNWFVKGKGRLSIFLEA